MFVAKYDIGNIPDIILVSAKDLTTLKNFEKDGVENIFIVGY